VIALLFVLVAIGAVLFGKSQAQPVTNTMPASDALPETQLSAHLAAGKPTLAFFHSNTCDQCIQMIKIVEKVYPEFAATVALVDVNVYEDRNAKLLQKVGLRYIPTLIFYDRAGKSQTSVGVIEAVKFRQTLAGLAAQ
jgi:thiol:disulfide interchange protein